jgi:hypothetical protein
LKPDGVIRLQFHLALPRPPHHLERQELAQREPLSPADAKNALQAARIALFSTDVSLGDRPGQGSRPAWPPRPCCPRHWLHARSRCRSRPGWIRDRRGLAGEPLEPAACRCGSGLGDR